MKNATARSARLASLLALAGCGPAGETSIGRHAEISCAEPPASDFCTALPALATPPVIDGKLECGLRAAAVPTAHHTANAEPPGWFAAQHAWAWRPEGLYAWVSVQSTQRRPPPAKLGRRYCGDSVDLMVDQDGRWERPPDYDATGTRQFVIPAPADATTPVRQADVYGPDTFFEWTWPSFGAFPTPGGYVVEALVKAADMGLGAWPLEPGGGIGFSLAINVAGLRDDQFEAGTTDCPQRLLSLWLRPPVIAAANPNCVSPHCNITAFCSVTLAE